MVDRLEITIHPEIPLVKQIESGLAGTPRIRSELYQAGYDLRSMGIPAFLFRGCRFNGSQKLVFRGASKMTLRKMANNIAQVFDSDPWESRLARVDFAVDMYGVKFDWIRDHVRVRGKRCCRECRSVSAGQEAKGITIYIGGRNDFFRFYDKSAQLAARSGWSLAMARREPDGVPIARIERQLRTSGIPAAISTLEDLRLNAPIVNPFRQVIFVKGGNSEPKIEDYPLRTYLEGTGFRELIRHSGLAKAWEIVNKRSGGNASRTFSRLADFIPPDHPNLPLPDLFYLHRSSLSRQLNSNRMNNEMNNQMRGVAYERTATER